MKPQFTYRQLCSIVGYNENTIRTWITKYLSNIGYKKDSGRMLYSGLDCVRVGIFADTTKLSISPVAAKMVTFAANGRIRKLMLMNKQEESKERREPLFMVFHDVDEKNASGNPELSASKLAKMYKKSSQPFLVVPVDSLYWHIKDRIIEMAIESNILPEGFSFD